MQNARASSWLTVSARISIALSAATVVAACGVEDRVLQSGSAGLGGLDRAIARFSLASCSRLRTCAPVYLRITSGTYDRCVERTKLMNEWVAGLPGNRQDTDLFLECAASWDMLPCGEVFSPFPIAACRQLGTRNNGDQCNFALQCSSGFCKQTGYGCGTCASMPAEGASCQVNTDCGETQWCMADKTCRTPSGLNEPCSDNLQCRLDLTCSNGSCIARPAAAGASCDGSTGLQCDFLAKDLYCTSSKTCAAASVKVAGQSCAEGGSYCEDNGTCTNDTCTAGAADDGPCNDDGGPYCEWPARCVGGSCQLPTKAGLQCGSG